MLIVLAIIGSSPFVALAVSPSSFIASPISTSVSTPVTTSYVSTVSSSSTSASVTSTSDAPPVMRISLPLYSSPNEEWNQVVNSSPTTGILIINANFGPGYSLNPVYAAAIQMVQQKGISVLGYVYTSYADGSVPVSKVENWISEWYSWYHVDGIFFDEVNSTCSTKTVNYYTSLYTYTKSQSGPDIVILNPGEPTGNCYASISDILVTFEGDYSKFINHYVPENWTLNYPPSRFWQIVYNATTLPQMQNAVHLASQRRSGWIYVTNGLAIGVNALGRLPSYFCQEVETVNSSNGACSTSNATTTTTETSALG